MALVKKVNPNWQPIESPGLQVGETIEKTDYLKLVQEGNVVLVDDSGNELELPGQEFNCPVCFQKIAGLLDFTTHVSSHLKAKNTTVAKKTGGKDVEMTEEEKQRKAEIRAKRLLALEKARKVRMEKKR